MANLRIWSFTVLEIRRPGSRFAWGRSVPGPARRSVLTNCALLLPRVDAPKCAIRVFCEFPGEQFSTATRFFAN